MPDKESPKKESKKGKHMKIERKYSLPYVFLVIFVFTFVSSFHVDAKKNHDKNGKRKNGNGHGHGQVITPGPAQSPFPSPIRSNVFDIISFGATGDGVSDDSKALVEAWKAACKRPKATIQISSNFKFLIKPITLQGPCMPHLVLQIDGELLAPPAIGSWPKSSLYQWINFKWVDNFTVRGVGTVNGQGSNWWTTSNINYIQKHSQHMEDTKPTAMRFYGSHNVMIRDIRIINSPQCHLKFDNSVGVKIKNITISAPESSPNTDGIHLQNTQDVEIQHSKIESGDDCVSIQTGCSNIHIHHISCGPGHGISLGGLGKDKSKACVSNINVENIIMQNTLSGVRIKTWQGGIGTVRNVTFSNIRVRDVKFPIVIDQYYCDKMFCKNQTRAVAITGVKYKQIIGTYLVQPIHLACSDDIPCTDVDLIDIQLKPSITYQGSQKALCWNSYGKSQAPLFPSSIDYCLRRSNDLVQRSSKSPENIC